MKWSKDNKQKLFDVFKKINHLGYDDWNRRVDKLGIIRLVRRSYGKKRLLHTEEWGGLYNRDNSYVQLSNPRCNEKQNSGSQHLIAIPKKLAEKIMIFEEIPLTWNCISTLD